MNKVFEEKDLAYAAAFIDGEGHISILKHTHPLMKIKKDRASVAINFGERRHLGGRSELEKRMDQADYELFRALNARGKNQQMQQVGLKK